MAAAPIDLNPTIELRPKSTRLSSEERAEVMKNLGFGRVFTEHQVTVAYRDGQGWGRGLLEPYAPIALEPAASVLNYGQAIFEGFKAYRQRDGRIATFRPQANARRFAASARRMAMPELPEPLFIGAADALIRQEQDWVPPELGQSLYLRPLMIATEAALGVRPAREYLFVLFGLPSGAYFAQGIQPLSVWLCKDFVRASPGGTGEAKCAGNYAASLVAQQRAIDNGCQQVIWLDAFERRYVEEMGGMNLFFVYRTNGKVRLVTPQLTGTLLPGITRDSILKLAPSMGYGVEERQISVDDWRRDAESGELVEVFACGTAAVVHPLGTVKSEEGSWTIPGADRAPIALGIRERLLAIQHGIEPDPHGWMHIVT